MRSTPSSRWSRPALRVAAAAAVLLAAGCGTRFHQVRGKLVWGDGSPVTQLTGGLVTFSNQAANISATGVIEPDGTFRLNCLKKDDGLPAGEYAVTVNPAELVVSEFADAAALKAARAGMRMVPAKYGHTSTSPLKVAVEAKTNEVTITLDKNPG